MTDNFTKITIDGIDISDYSQYYVINHITKKEEPKRAVNFSLSNINDIIQIEIPEIFITFKYIPIELYRQLFKATRKAEFKVVYYDQDYDEIRTNMFYLKEPSSISPHSWGASRFQNKNKAFLGFRDYKLDLVCTLNPISDLDIQLQYNSVQIEKPYYIKLSKEQNSHILNFKITSLSGNALAGQIVATFSNDELTFNNASSSSAGKYILNCQTAGSNYQISLANLKRSGEYTLFLTINNLEYQNESYGSMTISVRLSIS